MGKNKGLVRTDPTFQQVYEPILRPRRTARSQQDDIQWMIERKLLEIAMNRFKWEGLPPEVDIRWMEMSLNMYALAVFFYDSTYGRYLALRGSPAGNVNMDGNFTQFHVYGNNMYNKELSIKECVPIWANYARYPDLDMIRIYSERIAMMDRTIEINSLNLRTQKILRTTQNTRLSVQQIRRQMEEGAQAIELDVSSMDPTDMVDVLDLGVDPNSIMNLHLIRTREWQECLNMLGLNSSNQDKKERLTAAETAGNDDIIAMNRAAALNARQAAAEKISDQFGLDVTVDYVTDMKTATLKDVSQGAAGTAGETAKVEA